MSKLSPQPPAIAVEPEMHPGGSDAIKLDADGQGLGRDLPPDLNPASEDVPEAIVEPDTQKDQAPSGEADAEAGTRTDQADAGPAAGQVDEQGSPEPPA